MSQHAAKIERRNLSRTLGQTGLALVERHGAALESEILPSLRALTAIAKASDGRLSALETFQSMDLGQRLMWLLFGEWPKASVDVGE